MSTAGAPASAAGFLRTAGGVVGEEWIDFNGHMGIAFYTEVFAVASRELWRVTGAAELEGGGPIVVASQLATRYRRELFAGDAWEVCSAFAAVGERAATLSHRLLSGGKTCAVCHIQMVALERGSRLPTRFPDPVCVRAGALRVPGLKDPFADDA